MEIVVVYHSESGNTKEVAELIQKGANKVAEIEAKTLDIKEFKRGDLKNAKAVIFGSPTYIGDISWQLKSFFGQNKLNLKGKIGAVFATENFLGGGADSALITIIKHLLVQGMLVYSGGAAAGKPYTHFGAVCIQNGDQEQQQRAEIFGERIAQKTQEIFA